jgi:transposase-like protein
VARKTYSEEFRRDAVELYRSTPGATVVGIAADLGIMDTTLSAWLKAAGLPLLRGSNVSVNSSRTGRPDRRARANSAGPGC